MPQDHFEQWLEHLWYLVLHRPERSNLPIIVSVEHRLQVGVRQPRSRQLEDHAFDGTILPTLLLWWFFLDRIIQQEEELHHEVEIHGQGQAFEPIRYRECSLHAFAK